MRISLNKHEAVAKLPSMQYMNFEQEKGFLPFPPSLELQGNA